MWSGFSLQIIPWQGHYDHCLSATGCTVAILTFQHASKFHLHFQSRQVPPRTEGTFQSVGWIMSCFIYVKIGSILLHSSWHRLPFSLTIFIYHFHLQFSLTIFIYHFHLPFSFTIFSLTIFIYHFQLPFSFTIVTYHFHLPFSLAIFTCHFYLPFSLTIFIYHFHLPFSLPSKELLLGRILLLLTIMRFVSLCIYGGCFSHMC
jgi:hypothetical protein